MNVLYTVRLLDLTHQLRTLQRYHLPQRLSEGYAQVGEFTSYLSFNTAKDVCMPKHTQTLRRFNGAEFFVQFVIDLQQKSRHFVLGASSSS